MKRGLSAASVALCACASYRVLPLASAAGASQALPVRYEKSRLFFSSTENDGVLERIFASGPDVLATTIQPKTGVEASSDSGATWVFSELPAERGAPQVLREVVFDARDPQRIWARAGARVLRSGDGGRSWAQVQPGGDFLDVLASNGAGGLIAVSRGRVFLSEDGFQTWQVQTPQIPAKEWRARNVVADPSNPQTLWMSIRSVQPPPEPGKDLFTRFVNVLGYSSEEAVSALSFVDAAPSAPRPIAWGAAGGDGVYVSHDGGISWRKTGLALDAFIAAQGGALWAMAADPLLEAAALVRRFPDLARIAEIQMRGDRANPENLREACRYPGRDRLLMGRAGNAAVFRSQDGGATWVRVPDPPLDAALALRAAVDRSSWDPNALRPAPRSAPRAPAPVLPGRRGAAYEGMQNAQRAPRVYAPDVSADTLLSFVDPMRLLAHFNRGMELSGISAGAGYVATEAWWNALASSLAQASADEGEVSLGPGVAPPAQGGAPFVLLRRTGSGFVDQSFSLPPSPPGMSPFPDSIASGDGQAFMVLAGRDRQGRGWRTGFRTTLLP